MRVLHVINGLAMGGAEAVLYRLTTYPSDVAHEVISLAGPDWYSSKLAAAGVPVRHLSWVSTASAPKTYLQLHRLVRQSDADLVQTWLYRSNLLGGMAAKSAGIPVVWNIRSSSLEPLRPGARMLAYSGGILARWVPELVVNCSSVSRELHERLGYESAEGVVIPNGYDPKVFFPDEAARSSKREALRIDRGSFLLGSIGRWDPHKDYPTLCRAIGLLRERGLPLRLFLVGRGLDSSNADLTRLIGDCGASDLIQAIGQQGDVPDLARAIDLHVLASASEGFPNVVAETMLSATPNVTTNVGDAGHIVGGTGWAVPPGDPAHLADAIQQAHAEWADSPEQWRIRRDAARERIIENFSLDGMVAAYEAAWKSVIARQPSKSTKAIEDTPSPEPLRVVHIINTVALGGAESLLYRLVTRESATRHTVVSLGPRSWYSPRLEESGVALHHLDMDSVVDVPRAAARLKRLLAESGADVVQCWMYRSNVFGGTIAQIVGKPVVWGIHCSSIKDLRPSARALVHVSRVLARTNPDFIINCSSAAADLHAKLGYDGAKSSTIYNGYDPSTFFPNEAGRLAAREALGLTAQDFAIASVTRWDPLKDLPNLIAAVRMAHDRGVPLRCFLIGAGLSRDNRALTEEIERANGGDYIIPLGSRSDLPNLARAVDFHVLVSRTEAFPNVVAETMLSGTPNAVTDVGDSAMMVGESGWVVPPRDPERLAGAIVEAYREWTDDPARWESRRKDARKQIEANYSIDRMSDAYHDVWRAVAAGRGPVHSKE